MYEQTDFLSVIVALIKYKYANPSFHFINQPVTSDFPVSVHLKACRNTSLNANVDYHINQQTLTTFQLVRLVKWTWCVHNDFYS